jgi:hypothetical protein
MASVYEALDLDLDLPVVLKVLPPLLARDPNFVLRFQREGQTLARLTHPNIVRLYSVGWNEDDNLYYLVLEYLRGGNLKARQGTRPWSLERVVQVLRPVALAVDFAHHHETPVVHRDLKPANIMFGNHDRVVVCDFGLARMLEPDGDVSQTSNSPWGPLTTDTILGTPEYMAPEQAEGRVPTSAVDRYALGVIAYELLVGTVPFRADTPRATLMQVLTRPLPLPSRANPDVNGRVEQALIKALARDPDRRYETATQFVESLAAARPRIHTIHDAGVDSVGGDERDLPRRWRRRYPILLGALGLALATLVSGAVLLSPLVWQKAAPPDTVGTEVSPAPTAVSGAALAAGPTVVPTTTPAMIVTHVATSPPTATATPTPEPTLAPGVDQQWDHLQPQLDRAWGSADWPTTISLLDDFLNGAPNFQPAVNKLYSALVISGKQLISAGETERGTAELERAAMLDPDRSDAQDALLALTPTPAPAPTPRPVVIPTAVQLRPTTAVQVVPTPTASKPPFTPPPLPTKPPFTPPTG